MPTWTATVTEHPDALEFRLSEAGRALAYEDVVRLWRDDDDFRRYYTTLLADAPFEAFFWETPPVTDSTVDRDYAFVLVDAPSMTRVTESGRAFAEHFRDDAEVVTFPNLGGDATLVAPTPGDADHTHLASFLRTASPHRTSALWETTAAAVDASLSAAPLWLSTCGTGVPWLHVRLDTRPKYYRWQPFTRHTG